MATKEIKKITVDQLARMMQSGFTRIEKSVQEGFAVSFEEFKRLNAEVKDIKTTLDPIVIIAAEHERRIQTLESRSERIEKKVGIVRLSR